MRLDSALRVVGLATVVGFAALLGARDATGVPRKAPPVQCHLDSDCALVPDGCCGCNEGGKQRAIPAAARDTYERKRKTACRNSACPALMSEDASCVSPHAVCKEGKCGLGS